MSTPITEGQIEDNKDESLTRQDAEQKPDENPAEETETEKTETEETDANDVASLPDWAQKEIADLRKEAADRRTKLRTAEDKLKSAKTPEEFETARSEWVTQKSDLERELVATKYSLPDALAARLKGDTREELEADAKSLQALINPLSDGTPSGGLTPGSDDGDELNPLALAKRALANRLF